MATKSKKPTFQRKIVVRKDDFDDGVGSYYVVIGDTDNLRQLDAEDGDYVAVYLLDRVVRFRQEPRFDELGKA